MTALLLHHFPLCRLWNSRSSDFYTFLPIYCCFLGCIDYVSQVLMERKRSQTVGSNSPAERHRKMLRLPTVKRSKSDQSHPIPTDGSLSQPAAPKKKLSMFGKKKGSATDLHLEGSGLRRCWGYPTVLRHQRVLVKRRLSDVYLVSWSESHQPLKLMAVLRHQGMVKKEKRVLQQQLLHQSVPVWNRRLLPVWRLPSHML